MDDLGIPYFGTPPVSKLLRCPAASFSPSCQELVALVVLPGALATNSCRLTPAEFRKETIWHVDTHIDPAEKMGTPKFDGFLIVVFF